MKKGLRYVPILKIGSAGEGSDFFGSGTGGGSVLFKLRNDVEPEKRRHIHQQRIAEQELERFGGRRGIIFFAGFSRESQLYEFGHQKHEGNDATHNVSVAVHGLFLLF